MASQKRRSSLSLKDRLLKEFYSFSFFKAVHNLERLFPGKKPLGQTLVPKEEVVRFSVKPSFVFPPSDISNMTHEEEVRPVAMEIAFMGLIGPSGVLPHWYNDLAIERARQKDHSLIAFFNLFHHRLISLFYLAWKKYRFPENYLPGAKDRLSRHLLGFVGLGTPDLTRRMGLPEESLIYFSGLLSRQVPSASAMEATVEYFSGMRAEVRQFIDRIIYISPEDQTQIGVANGQLGLDAVCGSSAWESQTKFQVNLGPMGYDDFSLFLPSGKRLRPIFSLIRYMAGIEYEFDIGLILKRKEVPPCVLGTEAPTPARLGWSTWVKAPEFIHPEDPCVVMQYPGDNP